jgi:hypothetical protein
LLLWSIAAGQEARFEAEPNLLTILDGGHMSEAAAKASVHPILVALGHRIDDVEGDNIDLPFSMFPSSVVV